MRIGITFFLAIFLGLIYAQTSLSEGLKQNSEFPELTSDIINRVEALKRIDPSVIQSSESLHNVVEKVFDSTIGHPVYVELSIRLNRTKNVRELLEFIEKYPDHYAASEAIRFIIKLGKTSVISDRINANLKTDEDKVIGLLNLLAGTGSQEGEDFLVEILLSSSTHQRISKQIITSLCSSKKGADRLIGLKISGKLPVSLELYSSQMLSLVPWPKTREQSTKHFSSIAGKGSLGLSLADLKQFPADHNQGRKVYNDPVIGCFRCHVVEGKGTHFGPELSLIADKLPPSAILKAIQEPSAGISFDYEAWEIEIDTTEFFYGIIVSETDEFIVIRDSLGVDQKIFKNTIISREKSKTSAMPSGLAELISPKQMANLIAYLSRLKKER